MRHSPGLEDLLRRDGIIIAAIPVLAPFHYVAAYRKRHTASIAVSLQLTAFTAIVVAGDLDGIEGLSTGIVRIGMINRITPWKAPLVCASRSLFPFGFGGQPILLPGLRA